MNASLFLSSRRGLRLLMAIIVVVSASCTPRARVAPPPDFPPPAPRVDGHAIRGLEKICLESLTLPGKMPDAEKREKAYVDLLRSELLRANLVLIGEDATRPVLERAYRKAGGMFDRETGSSDSVRYARVHKAGLLAMKDELGCDAAMKVTFPVVRSHWVGLTATWDGITQTVPGGMSGVEGWIPALSVWIRMNDMTDREIYFSAGGIQVLSELERPGPYARPELKTVDAKNWLASDELNRKSVEVALTPMLWARSGGAEDAAGAATLGPPEATVRQPFTAGFALRPRVFGAAPSSWLQNSRTARR